LGSNSTALICGTSKLYNRVSIKPYNVYQSFHKGSLQFKKIISKADDEISQRGFFYINQNLIKFILTLKFFVSDKIFMCSMNELYEPL